jgi:hypothetical protein
MSQHAGKSFVISLLRLFVTYNGLLRLDFRIQFAIQFARTDQTTPREITSIVSRKYRLVVSVTTRSFEPEAGDPSYQVHRIEMQHGK